MKKCSSCKEEKYESEFGKNIIRKDGLHNECKECKKLRNKKYYHKTKDAKRESERDRQRIYRENNRDKVNERSRKFYENNPERVLASKINYKAKRRILESKFEPLTKEEYVIIMNSTDWKCFYCNTKLNKQNRSIDHFIPLNKGGDHTIFNLVPACRSCNSSKKDKLYYEWKGIKI